MTRVIRADRAGAALVPRAVLDARERARAILELARGEAEVIRAQAAAEGRAQGRAELAAQRLALEQERERALAELEPAAVAIALSVAKRVIGHELDTRPALVAEWVAALLARLRGARRVTLRVNPDDAAELAPRLSELAGAVGLAGSVQIEPDPQASRGSCVLVSDIGTLDARIEVQLEALAKALGAM